MWPVDSTTTPSYLLSSLLNLSGYPRNQTLHPLHPKKKLTWKISVFFCFPPLKVVQVLLEAWNRFLGIRVCGGRVSLFSSCSHKQTSKTTLQQIRTLDQRMSQCLFFVLFSLICLICSCRNCCSYVTSPNFMRNTSATITNPIMDEMVRV